MQENVKIKVKLYTDNVYNGKFNRRRKNDIYNSNEEYLEVIKEYERREMFPEKYDKCFNEIVKDRINQINFYNIFPIAY